MYECRTQSCQVIVGGTLLGPGRWEYTLQVFKGETSSMLWAHTGGVNLCLVHLVVDFPLMVDRAKDQAWTRTSLDTCSRYAVFFGDVRSSEEAWSHLYVLCSCHATLLLQAPKNLLPS